MRNLDEIEHKFYRGTIFTITYLEDIVERNSFVLAECLDNDYIFQIICISGYNSGTIFGYVDYGILGKHHKAITKEELVVSIKKTF